MRARGHCPAPIASSRSEVAAKRRYAGAFAGPGSGIPQLRRPSLTFCTRDSSMTVRLPLTGRRAAHSRDRVAGGSSSTNSAPKGFRLRMRRQRHPTSMMMPRLWHWRRAAPDSCEDWTGRPLSVGCPTISWLADSPEKPCRGRLPRSCPSTVTRSQRASMVNYTTTISGRRHLTSSQAVHAG